MVVAFANEDDVQRRNFLLLTISENKRYALDSVATRIRNSVSTALNKGHFAMRFLSEKLEDPGRISL